MQSKLRRVDGTPQPPYAAAVFGLLQATSPAAGEPQLFMAKRPTSRQEFAVYLAEPCCLIIIIFTVAICFPR